MSTCFYNTFLRTTASMWIALSLAATLIAMSSISSGQSSDDDACAVPGYAGLDIDQIQIPRVGLYNPLLQVFFGDKIENTGTPIVYEGCQFIKGPVSMFGGPNDKTISSKEIAALTGEQLRALNNPPNPTPAILAQNADLYYYAAMRIKYSEQTIKKWKAARILVVNPKTGATVSLRIIDWGPGGKRLIDMSPKALRDLGLHTDEQPYVAFGVPELPLGVISESARETK